MSLDAGEHTVRVTNLDKALWPETPERAAITKRDMLTYYARIAPAILPHLRDRPLTLTRYPNGVDAPSFYQKNWSYEPPEFVETVKLFSSHNEGDVEYVMANNLATLLWLAQLADIEMHPWLSRRATGPDGTGLGTHIHQFEGEHRGQYPQLPRLPRLRLRPLHLFRRGRGGRRARAQPPRLRQGRGDCAGAEGHP